MAPHLVLASTSPYRRELLERLRLPFTCAAPPYQEEHELPLPPETLVVELAVRKARSLALAHPEALILAADQVAVLNDRLLHKPGTPKRAVEQLLALRGCEHRLLTGVAMFEPYSGRLETALNEHLMRMRPLTEAQVRRYVDKDNPIDCAGAYKIEGLGIALFDSMRGHDFTGIIGLPLTRVVELLERFSWAVP